MMNKLKSAEEYLKPYHLSYRDQSDRDSYSSYREGYSDAMDIAGQVIEQAQKDAYNQAIDDVIKSVKIVNTKKLNFETGKWENVPLIDQTSILKLKK